MDENTVEEVAGLARLWLGKDEIARARDELGKILDSFSRLQELDTDGVEPMVYAVELVNVYRKSEPCVLDREQALSNAPDTDGVHFRVPRILNETRAGGETSP
jgi:aspartyl-tRNA(Asn)/glutamyl-tRNA(Gln) amidotransferase subunit C